MSNGILVRTFANFPARLLLGALACVFAFLRFEVLARLGGGDDSRYSSNRTRQMACKLFLHDLLTFSDVFFSICFCFLIFLSWAISQITTK